MNHYNFLGFSFFNIPFSIGVSYFLFNEHKKASGFDVIFSHNNVSFRIIKL